jgi:hypothetical protein
MSKRAFVPDDFALGLLVIGLAVLVLPALRVTGVIAMALAVLYWLVMGLFVTLRG